MSGLGELIEGYEAEGYIGGADPLAVSIFGKAGAYAAQGATTGPVDQRLDSAVILLNLLFPDFWYTTGVCNLSGHASIGPDYLGPAGEALRAVWPESRFHCGFDADLKPGGSPERAADAMIDCIFQALKAKAELAVPS